MSLHELLRTDIGCPWSTVREESDMPGYRQTVVAWRVALLKLHYRPLRVEVQGIRPFVVVDALQALVLPDAGVLNDGKIV